MDLDLSDFPKEHFLDQKRTAGESPWKINMEHHNGGLEDDFPLQICDF